MREVGYLVEPNLEAAMQEPTEYEIKEMMRMNINSGNLEVMIHEANLPPEQLKLFKEQYHNLQFNLQDTIGRSVFGIPNPLGPGK